jgi:glutamate carboxypeptidase
MATSHVPGTKAVLTIKGEFLPLTQSPAAAKLFKLYKQWSRDVLMLLILLL